MEIRSDKSLSEINRPVSFSVGLMAVLSIFLWLIGFFRLSKEDRLAVGICMRSNEPDE